MARSRQATIAIVRSAEEFLQLRSLLEEYELDLDEDLRHGAEVPDMPALRAEYAPPNAAFLAFVEGEPAGCAGCVRHDDSTAVLQRLYAKPDYRGYGIGRALTVAAIDYARAGGFERIGLDTHAGRLRTAYGLYQSLGFADCEPFARVGYPCPTFMELRLRG